MNYGVSSGFLRENQTGGKTAHLSRNRTKRISGSKIPFVPLNGANQPFIQLTAPAV
jgi:hypothetical protein